MKLWKRASGALKDHSSLWLASLTRRSALRNPDIEAAVIKATSHDEYRVNFRNAQRVFAWVHVSHTYLRPVLWAISIRMEKTSNWVVALKGLMLLHGVFCCKVPGVQNIGRLPFDLSNFTDRHSSPGKMWSFNAFVRAYYKFLDQKSSFIFIHAQEKKEYQKRSIRGDEKKQTVPMMQELLWLQKLQDLLDMLLQIKPQGNAMMAGLILEAMDCVVIEIFDVYSRICNGIAGILVRIYSAGKAEASMALTILQKATVQGEELASYFEFCADIGVINASECPKVELIPEEDIREIEDIINGVSRKNEETKEIEKASMITTTTTTEKHCQQNNSLQTIITNNWEVFEESPKILKVELPDLISF